MSGPIYIVALLSAGTLQELDRFEDDGDPNLCDDARSQAHRAASRASSRHPGLPVYVLREDAGRGQTEVAAYENGHRLTYSGER